MWDLDTIVRMNEKAAAQARKDLPERATEASKPDEGQIIKLPSPVPVSCACAG